VLTKAALDGLLASARERWPSVHFDATAVESFVTERVDGETFPTLDLVLAAACAL
jgi:hypothetical protein